MQSAKVTCKDWLSVANEYKDDPAALIFLDPPYFSSDNSTYGLYDETADATGMIADNTKIYIDILDFSRTSKAKVFMIINDNALLRHVYKDYASPPHEKTYGSTHVNSLNRRRKNKTMHMFVSNWGATSPLPPPSTPSLPFNPDSNGGGRGGAKSATLPS